MRDQWRMLRSVRASRPCASLSLRPAWRIRRRHMWSSLGSVGIRVSNLNAGILRAYTYSISAVVDFNDPTALRTWQSGFRWRHWKGVVGLRRSAGPAAEPTGGKYTGMSFDSDLKRLGFLGRLKANPILGIHYGSQK